MPQTSRGFWYEHYPEDPIGHSVRTGFPGDPSGNDHLAQQIQDELDAADNNAASLESRIAALEAVAVNTRWRHIASAIRGAGDFTIVVPAGFERLRLTLVGDMDNTGEIDLRINGDSGNNYIWGRRIIDSDGVVDFQQHSSTVFANAWRLAQWGTVESNSLVVDLFPTDGGQGVTMLARGSRISSSPTAHMQQSAWGKYTPAVVVNSLTVIDSVTTFASVRYWLEGYVAP